MHQGRILAISILFMFLASCITGPAQELSVKGPKLDIRLNPITFNIGTDAGPQGTVLFNQALNYLTVQDWDKAVESLLEGARQAPKDHRGVFTNLLKLMLDQPFPVQQVCAALTELNPVGTGDYHLLSTLAKASPMEVRWPSESVVLPWLGPPAGGFAEFFGFSTRNLPTVEVKINGATLRMVLDTGAAVNFLYADAARKAGLKTQESLRLDMASSNSLSGKAELALADSLTLGSLEIRHPRIWTSNRPLGYDNYDGLVGWPVLSQMAMRMDSRKGQITLDPSVSRKNPAPTYLWLGEPLVLVLDLQQTWAHPFMMDSGAVQTLFENPALQEFKADFSTADPKLSSGVYGLDTVPSTLVKTLDCLVDGFTFQFRNYRNYRAGHHFFGFVKGILGCDLTRQGVVTLDFPAGTLDFEPWPKDGLVPGTGDVLPAAPANHGTADQSSAPQPSNPATTPSVPAGSSP